MSVFLLKTELPNAEVLLELEPEELGAKIIGWMQKAQPRDGVKAGSVMSQFYPINSSGDTPEYPRALEKDVEGAIFEAWSWLEAQGLIIWADFGNGSNGYRRLSRKATAIQVSDFKDFKAARLLPKEALHLTIRERVWGDFVRGHYDSAVSFAAKRVEISVRDACGYAGHEYGMPMVRKAFNKEAGPLTDMNAVIAERDARSSLFAGFIGSYKNPSSHRDINIEDPVEAIEIVLMASHLLRIVDARVEVNKESP